MSAEPTFEQAQAELEQIVERLERGDVGLDELTKLWERGEELYKRCAAALTETQIASLPAAAIAGLTNTQTAALTATARSWGSSELMAARTSSIAPAPTAPASTWPPAARCRCIATAQGVARPCLVGFARRSTSATDGLPVNEAATAVYHAASVARGETVDQPTPWPKIHGVAVLFDRNLWQ